MTDAASEVGAPTARQLVIDFFTDTEGDQTVDQVMAGTGITSRDAAHQALHRAAEAGLIERVAVGVYRIAPVKPLHHHLRSRQSPRSARGTPMPSGSH